jgi:hypothetical protein
VQGAGAPQSRNKNPAGPARQMHVFHIFLVEFSL